MTEKGVCLVVSPLIALMKDQVENLTKKGIKAVAIAGLQSKDDIVRIFDNLQFGGIRFLYLSPERLQSEFIQEKLKQIPLKLIAIDEAHCISEWGHDFRPSYLKLNLLRELFPEINIIALTATATNRVRKDIATYLELKEPQIFQKSLTRDNLHLKILESADKLGSLYRIIEPINEPVIVYAGTRKNCKRTSEILNQKGLKSVYYHAGLSKSEKDTSFTNWFTEKTPVMVATNAFGMGIDKANVRLVVHTSVPNSIENYVQEAGRAGRDGKMSYAVIIEEPADLKESETYYTNSIANVSFVKKLYQHLNQYFHIAYGDLVEKEFEFQLASFCQQYNMSIVKTFNGLQLLEREEIIKLNSHNNPFSKLVFTANSEQLFAYYIRNSLKEKILKLILRTYDGVFDTMQIINPYILSKKLNLSLSQLEKQLIEIHNDGLINYKSVKNRATLRFLKPREDDYTINRIARDIKQQQQVKKDKYTSMIAYISNSEICRNQQLSNYFGEKNTKDCGICDVCENKKNTNNFNEKEICNAILKSFTNKKMQSSNEIVHRLGLNDKPVLKAIRILLDSEAIIVTSQNKYKLNV